MVWDSRTCSEEAPISFRSLAKMEMNAKRLKPSSSASPYLGCGNWPLNSTVKAQDVPESILVVEGHQEIEHPEESSENRALEMFLYGFKSCTDKRRRLCHKW